jgi:Periplasmic binding protein
MTIHRGSALKGLAATGTGIFGAPAILPAGIEPIRIGFLTVKTGPLASGGIQMEEGLTLYLKERNSTLSGRPVQLFTADTGGVPALTESKAQELVERAKVHCSHHRACGPRPWARSVVLNTPAPTQCLRYDPAARRRCRHRHPHRQSQLPGDGHHGVSQGRRYPRTSRPHGEPCLDAHHATL